MTPRYRVTLPDPRPYGVAFIIKVCPFGAEPILGFVRPNFTHAWMVNKPLDSIEKWVAQKGGTVEAVTEAVTDGR